MNPSLKLSVVAMLAGGLALSTLAGPSPGEVDFSKFAPAGQGAKFIEINVKSTLISLAAKFVEEDEPETAQLLRAVRLVRVNVIGLNDQNRDGLLKQIQEVRAELDKAGWERIVAAQERNGEDVGIYVKTRGEEALEGFVVTVVDGRKKEAVLINVVGDIRPDQVAAVGKALSIDPLKQVGASLKNK
jgi:hypothetical protein